jgi:hypothetical protein
VINDEGYKRHASAPPDRPPVSHRSHDHGVHWRVLTVRHAGVLAGVMLVVLAAVGLALLARARLTARSR